MFNKIKIAMQKMNKNTQQIQKWSGEFGKEYTDRNTLLFDEWEAALKKNYGITRTEMNMEFIGNLDRSIRILEVGSNVGNQLVCLKKMGFQFLYGIELQQYAVELSKSRTSNINIIQGSAFDIPYKDGFFDLVFTSGVLIHISPTDIIDAINEIYRCSKRYIWGFEYFSDKYSEIPYRGNNQLMWKGDFKQKYIEEFPELSLVKEKKYKYLYNENIDTMFLLQKV